MSAGSSPLQIARAKPLYKQIKSLILEQIDKGELRPHDRLPSERHYSHITGISRLTVRKALDELALTGVLYRQPGKGTYIAPIHSSGHEVRFNGHTSLLAETAQTTYRLLSRTRSHAPPFAAQLLGVGPRTSVVCLEQLISVRGEPRLIHRGYVPLPTGERLMRTRETSASLLDLMIRYGGDRPAATRERLIPGLAKDHDAALLAIARHSPVQILMGCMLSHTGAPIEAHEVVIRADRVKLELEFDLHP